MARKPLRSQLNQIRAWVRQGRTDAWIAHQLDVSTAELREFRRRHELSADDDSDAELDLRDEIEAEIEATMAEEDDGEEDEEEEEEEDGEEGRDDGDERGGGRGRRGEAEAPPPAPWGSRPLEASRHRDGGHLRPRR